MATTARDVDDMKQTLNHACDGLLSSLNASKGQVSLEMLLIVTFLMMTLIPLIAYMYNIFSEDIWKVDIQQAQSVVEKIAEYSDKLSMGGEGASTQFIVYFPSKVKNFTTVGRAIIISTETPSLGQIDQVAITKGSVNSSLVSWEGIGGMQRIYMNYSHGIVYIYRE